MTNLKQNIELVVFCTVEAGLDSLNEILRQGYKASLIIGLHSNANIQDTVSGWIDIKTYCLKNDIEFYLTNDYSLNHPLPSHVQNKIKQSLVLVSGWQRLIPPHILNLNKGFFIGGHGSPDGIEKGRGRSPQNWALLLNCSEFKLSLFQLKAGVDNGPIVLTKSFFLNDEDNIRTSYHKCALTMAEMVIEILINPSLIHNATEQNDNDAYYYPQRLPEDGEIDWSTTKQAVKNQIRALTSPYPGAWTTAHNHKIKIWSCMNFDGYIGKPGEIGSCFLNGDFTVNCADGRLLITRWTSDTNSSWQPSPNTQLNSANQKELFKKIIDRHYKKTVNQKISPRLLKYYEQN